MNASEITLFGVLAFSCTNPLGMSLVVITKEKLFFFHQL